MNQYEKRALRRREVEDVIKRRPDFLASLERQYRARGLTTYWAKREALNFYLMLLEYRDMQLKFREALNKITGKEPIEIKPDPSDAISRLLAASRIS
jgi:hypothetical protein